MLRFTIILLLILSSLKSLPQSGKEYRRRSAEIQNEIWSDSSSQFHVKDIPAGLIRENAVVIATSFELINSSKFVFKFGGPAKKLRYQITTHERIKINSQKALSDFSTIEYLKSYNRTHVNMYDVYFNISNTYVGAKIIRPDGSEVIIHHEEEPDKNKKRNEEASLTVAGLQVGDILDYYIRMEKMEETGTTASLQGPYTFQIGSEYYPILFNNIKFQLGENFAVNYINMNGAPALKQSRDAENNINLELTQTNLPRIKDTLWTSNMRQYPFILIQYQLLTKLYSSPMLRPGEVKRGDFYSYVGEELRRTLSSPFLPGYFRLADNRPLKITSDYFGGSENMKLISQDSIAKILYAAWYYNVFFMRITDTAYLLHNAKYSHAISLMGAVEMSKMLSTLDIKNTLYFVSSRYSKSLENVMNITDFDAIVKVNTNRDQTYWLAFDNMVTKFNEIPVRFQGEGALTMQEEGAGRKSGYETGQADIPVISSAVNKLEESIQVRFDSSNMQVLQMDRTCVETGAMRDPNQIELVLLEDIEANLASSLSRKKMVDRLTDEKRKKKADEFSAAFAQERADQKEYFIKEINDQYGHLPIDLSEYSVLQPDLGANDTSFGYKTVFSMKGLVIRNGENYSIEVSKLAGHHKELDSVHRERTLDIYFESTRTLNWNITINIPKGYSVKGIAEMNISVSNEVGSFKSTASNYGNKINIKAEFIGLKNYEPIRNWLKLLELTDAFEKLFGHTIIFQKIGL